MSTQEVGQMRYDENKQALFSLAFKTGLLTVITLGIYRFWSKTRIRKHIWSSTQLDGDRFEYTGTGLEKFLGFLVAIVVLAIYLGIVQVLLTFIGLSVFVVPDPNDIDAQIGQIMAVYITAFATMPLVFFAQYRSRRYKMGRTRFRGIRFGMTSEAWGYTWRAIVYWFLVMITLGILTPLMAFRLEQYMTDRSYFGDAKFQQNGKWTALYAAMKHVFIGFGILVVGIIAIAATAPVLGAVIMVVGYIWLLVGGIYFQVHAFGYLMSNKSLDGKIEFRSTPRTGPIVKAYLLGGFLVYLAASLLFGVAFGFGAVVGEISPVLGAILAIGAVTMAIALTSALALILIAQPVISHYISESLVIGAEHFDEIKQRAADMNIDADGFADALDIGGAI